MSSPSRLLRPRLVVLAGLLAGLAAAGCQPAAPTGAEPPPTASSPAPAAPPGPPLFEDVTAASGIAFAYRNGEDTANHLAILESLGGGVGLIDYDGDGLLDVFLPGGGGFEGPDQKTIVGNPCKLYRNLGGGKFRDVSAEVGLDKLGGGRPWFYTHGVAVADYDRDGWPDLLVTGWGAVALFHNVPVDPADPKKGRRFAEVTAKAGLGQGITWATSAAFADLDGDGYPDLYVCQYVDWSWQKNPACQYDGKTPDVCPPKQFDGLQHKVFRNTGKGGFVDETEAAGLRSGGPLQSKGLGVLIVDVDGDGKPDVYVANDTVDNFLYLNKSRPGAIRLEERGLESGVARDDRGNANGSMGADAGDPEHTGKPYLWVTNYENELHALYKNDSVPGRPFFNFHSTAAGIGAIGQKFVGWGTAFVDADLDGWEDLVVVNGHAIRFPTGKNSSRRQRPVLLLNQGGKRFVQASDRIGPYAESPRLARGVGFGDLDNDGRTDLVISHMNEPVAVLRGVGGQGKHWIGVRLEGRGHACTVGARAVWEADGQRQTRFAKGGGSYASSGDRRLLFGLGTRTTGRLTIYWPDGTQQTFDGLAVDRYYRIEQGSTKPEAEAERKK
jgi:enediyne biosynthesis protein E4